MATQVFKGFKQVTSATTSFESGYIYFVRTDADKNDGYVYFNGKKYGTAKEVKDFIGELPTGSGSTVVEYIQKVASGLTADIAAEAKTREDNDKAIDDKVVALSASTVSIEGNLSSLSAQTVVIEGNLAQEIEDREDADDELREAISAITADFIKTVEVNGTALEAINNTVNVTVEEGLTNGTVKVNGSDVNVHGLQDAAYETLAHINASAQTMADDAYAKATGWTETNYATSADTVNAIAEAKEEAITATTVTITSASTTEGSVLRTYTFKQGGETIGTIDLPKDMVVSGGAIVEIENVKYLRLYIANSSQYVDIPVSDLCDVYTGDGSTVEVSNTNVISVKDNVFDLSGAADEALTSAKAYADTKKTEAISSANTYTDTQIAQEVSNRDAAIATAKSEAISSANTYTDAEILKLSGSTKSAVENLQDQIDDVNTALTIEIAAREAADEDLEDAINAEVSARTDADTTLQNNINAEVSARTTADSALDTRIKALEDMTGTTLDALQSVSAADTSVTVGAKDAQKDQSIKVNISAVSDNALKLESDGLFAAVYYEDLDA